MRKLWISSLSGGTLVCGYENVDGDVKLNVVVARRRLRRQLALVRSWWGIWVNGRDRWWRGSARLGGEDVFVDDNIRCVIDRWWRWELCRKARAKRQVRKMLRKRH